MARQSQAVGFRGPCLGVTYYKSREEQLALEQKKQKEREESAKQKAEYDRMLVIKRDVIEFSICVSSLSFSFKLAIEKKKNRLSAQFEDLKDRRKSRIGSRDGRGRTRMLKNAPAASQVVERSPSPVKYGMDAEHAEKVFPSVIKVIRNIL